MNDSPKDPKITGLSQPEVFPCTEIVMSTNISDVVIHIDETLLASPVIIGPVAMLGFPDNGETDEGQAI
jgi:hypothetical protein